jgi:hypothetical protein
LLLEHKIFISEAKNMTESKKLKAVLVYLKTGVGTTGKGGR